MEQCIFNRKRDAATLSALHFLLWGLDTHCRYVKAATLFTINLDYRLFRIVSIKKYMDGFFHHCRIYNMQLLYFLKVYRNIFHSSSQYLGTNLLQISWAFVTQDECANSTHRTDMGFEPLTLVRHSSSVTSEPPCPTTALWPAIYFPFRCHQFFWRILADKEAKGHFLSAPRGQWEG